MSNYNQEFALLEENSKFLNKRLVIYAIDDDANFRKSLHFMLLASSIMVWPFATATDFLEQLKFLSPAPILLDIRIANIDGCNCWKSSRSGQ